MHKENESLFNFIKQRVQILNVINEHVALKKAGHYWKGRCPFHDEKTASFTVSPHREIFYCFGCHAGGDVISFVSKVENCNPLEAAKSLADRYNIDLPETIATPKLQETADERKRYFDLCKTFANWAHQQLAKYPSIVSYLQKRGFTQNSIEEFEIGYFPSGERSIKAFIKELNAHNFLVKDVLNIHLISEGKGNLYSPFEQRIIFPIKDHLGRHCGFGGRIVKSTDERAKYYNSRENTYFQKGSLLFGLDKAKKSIQKTGQVFLVEGYTDCIAMVQHGILNTVATLGTACTIEHLKQLAYHAQTLYLVYDADKAGEQAMLRLAELCWQVNLDLRTIFLPEGQDPASFLEHNGNFEELIPQSKDILSFFLANVGKTFAHQSLQEKLSGVRKFLGILKNLDDPLKQEVLLQKAATTFGLPIESLQKELQRSKPDRVSSFVQESTPQQENKLNFDTLSNIEKKFACAILNDSSLLGKKEVARLVEYAPPELLALLKKITKPLDKEAFIPFFETLEYHEKQLVNQLLLSQEPEEQDFDQILLSLEKKYWKMIVNGTKLKIAQAQQEDNAQKVNEIVVSFLELKKKLLRKGLI